MNYRIWLIKKMGYWPPYLGAGIKVDFISKDFLKLRSSLKLRWYNRNYVGTHFGGSIYSMTDPFYMLMLMHHLGSNYIVWDLAAKIRFKAPGRGKIFADFKFTLEEINAIRIQSVIKDKILVQKTLEVKDEQNNTIAVIKKIIYVRKKN